MPARRLPKIVICAGCGRVSHVGSSGKLEPVSSALRQFVIDTQPDRAKKIAEFQDHITREMFG